LNVSLLLGRTVGRHGSRALSRFPRTRNTLYFAGGCVALATVAWTLRQEAHAEDGQSEINNNDQGALRPYDVVLNKALQLYQRLPSLSSIYFFFFPQSEDGKPAPKYLDRLEAFAKLHLPNTYNIILARREQYDDLYDFEDDESVAKGVVRPHVELVDLDEPPPSKIESEKTKELSEWIEEISAKLNPPEPLFEVEEDEQEMREQQKTLDLKEDGKMSLHPHFPNDRLWYDYIQHFGDNFERGEVLLLPSRVPLPYGKALTLVIDAAVLYTKDGRRPGVDAFLSRVFEKYEIIMYGETLYVADGKVDPGIVIDGHYMYTTHHLTPRDCLKVNKWCFKSCAYLNRPEESTIIVDWNPENTVGSPWNAVILKPWDGKDYADESLLVLNDYLDWVADEIIQNKKLMPMLTLRYQDWEKDVVDIWRDKH